MNSTEFSSKGSGSRDPYCTRIIICICRHYRLIWNAFKKTASGWLKKSLKNEDKNFLPKPKFRWFKLELYEKYKKYNIGRRSRRARWHKRSKNFILVRKTTPKKSRIENQVCEKTRKIYEIRSWIAWHDSRYKVSSTKNDESNNMSHILRQFATNVSLYPLLWDDEINNGLSLSNLISLCSHENNDIAAAVIQTLYELVDQVSWWGLAIPDRQAKSFYRL